MAYADSIVSCDLCDLVGTGYDTRFHSVEGSVSDLNRSECEFMIATPEMRDRAVLCSQCAEPIAKLARALKDKTDARARLNERVRAALDLPPRKT